jgi:hypothetical protein
MLATGPPSSMRKGRTLMFVVGIDFLVVDLTRKQKKSLENQIIFSILPPSNCQWTTSQEIKVKWGKLRYQSIENIHTNNQLSFPR